MHHSTPTSLPSRPSLHRPSAEPASQAFDAIILGAGAAGLFCAAQAGKAGLRILLIDHARKLAEKIRISGGGRSNFTNRDLDPRAPQRHYLSQNAHFCRSALSRFTPQDFVALVQAHGIGFHEKHKGQLFCDHSSNDLIDMLDRLCQQQRVQRWQHCRIERVDFQPAADNAPEHPPAHGHYQVHTERGLATAPRLVVATGGLSIPKIGASDLGYRIARQFGIGLIEQRPGLVPLTFDAPTWHPFKSLAGISLPARIATGVGKNATHFDEDLLFTHRGLSGPGILQISSYWQPGQPLCIDLLPGIDLTASLQQARQHSRKLLANELAQWLPARLAQTWTQQSPTWQQPIDQTADRALRQLADSLQQWHITPSGTEGYAKAEVTLGGVDTRALSSQSMECRQQPGLFFIGEVLDVTGWLGGYNFQWAWASAHACARALAQPLVAATVADSTKRRNA